MKREAFLTVLGGVLVHLTLGGLYTLGNLNPYLVSYIHAKHPGSSVRPADMTWVFATAASSQSVFMWVGGALERRIGPRMVAVLGCSIASAGMALAHFACTSFAGQILTLGLCYGCGVGIAYTPPLACGMKWFPDNKGLVNGIIVAGFGASAFVFDQVQTAFINPHNEQPVAGLNAAHPKDKYFPPSSDVIHRVPNVMLLLAAVFVVLQVVGVSLLRVPDKRKTGLMERLVESDKGEEDEGADDSDANDLPPSAAVRTWQFWALWWMFLFNNQMVIFTSTLYKIYGEDRDLSDHYLAYVGAVSALFNGLGRLCWGVSVDRAGFWKSMTLLQVLLMGMMLTWTLSDNHAPGGFGHSLHPSKAVNKGLFMIWVCVIFFCIGGNYSMFPTAVAKAFGNRHAGTNYGLVFSANVVSNLVGALLASQLESALKWGWLTVLVASLVAVGLAINLASRVDASSRD